MSVRMLAFFHFKFLQWLVGLRAFGSGLVGICWIWCLRLVWDNIQWSENDQKLFVRFCHQKYGFERLLYKLLVSELPQKVSHAQKTGRFYQRGGWMKPLLLFLSWVNFLKSFLLWHFELWMRTRETDFVEKYVDKFLLPPSARENFFFFLLPPSIEMVLPWICCQTVVIFEYFLNYIFLNK